MVRILDNMEGLQTLPATNSAPKNIPIDILIDYANKGLSYADIGKAVGCSHSNVIRRLDNFGYDKKAVDSFKSNRADIYAVYGRKILYSVTDSDIQKMAPRDRFMAMGILYDKERLERQGLASDAPAADQGDLMHSLANIATRSPQIINNIINVVGNMSEDIRDRLARILPASLTNTNNNANIIDGKLSHE
jgi:hypothetical protein